ncbi:hypothetical protein ACLB2K_019075 [Fragaria x ananassa]
MVIMLEKAIGFGQWRFREEGETSMECVCGIPKREAGVLYQFRCVQIWMSEGFCTAVFCRMILAVVRVKLPTHRVSFGLSCLHPHGLVQY